MNKPMINTFFKFQIFRNICSLTNVNDKLIGNLVVKMSVRVVCNWISREKSTDFLLCTEKLLKVAHVKKASTK
jgi:hypothetical protein